MKVFRIGLIMTIAMLLTAASAYAQSIGVVDFQRVLKESKAGKAAKQDIERKGKGMEEKLKKQGEEIEKLKKKLEAEAMVMSQEKRDEKERDFRIKVTDFKVLQKKSAREFKEFEGEIIKRIQKEVFDLVEQIGRKEGFGLIVERGAALYYPENADVTDKLIKAYDAIK